MLATLLPWVAGLGSVGTLGALLWGMFERGGKLEANRQQERAEEGKARAELERDTERDRARRLESVILSLKEELRHADAARDPARVGERLDALLSAPAGDTKS